MHRGWTKLYRKIQCHWLWNDKPFSKGQAWIDLLLSANHEEKKFLLGGNLLEVKPGEVVTSIAKLSKDWGWSNTKVIRFLETLEREGMLTKKSDTKKTVITIENYSKYSIVDSEKTTPKRHENETETFQEHFKDISETHKQELLRTNKNYKELLRNKKEGGKEPRTSKKFVKPTYEEVKQYCKERNNNVNAHAFIDFYESKGWQVGSNPMKDWKAAVRTWERRYGGAKYQDDNVEANMLGEFI